MKATERFIVEYIPAAAVAAVAAKYRRKINAGYSVWDIAAPDDMTVSLPAKTETAAWQLAKHLVPLDDCGQVHVTRQSWQANDNEWDDTDTAVVDSDSAEFDWQTIAIKG